MPRTRSKGFDTTSLPTTRMNAIQSEAQDIVMDFPDEATTALQIEALVGSFTRNLKRQVDKERTELKAENVRCHRIIEKLETETERLRQVLDNRGTAHSREREVWIEERRQWELEVQQFCAELDERDGQIQGLQHDVDELLTKFDHDRTARRAGLEVITTDTVQFWQSAQAAQELVTRQIQRVLLIQLDQILREEEQPKSLQEILDILVNEDNETAI